NPNVCSIYQYYFYIFEEDDEKVKELSKSCRQGEILCGDCKKELAERVAKFLEQHQKKREKARDKLEEFMLRD
ncbi:MAG: tryptophan--tRNA ligase, partial [Candidatus Hydrothermarchaeota archaeon]|nr:tryptophan--tRNA ligase [Candidatus Hydrothermarchaeota archaeon]